MKNIVKWKNIDNSVVISGKVYYLNLSSGNDSSDGLSTSKAWKTESHAEETIDNGDVVITKTEGEFPHANFSEYAMYKMYDIVYINEEEPLGCIIDHDTRILDNIPTMYITAAKSTLHIAYQQTSHGSQILTGMEALLAYYGTSYQFSDDGSSGLHFDTQVDGRPISEVAQDLTYDAIQESGYTLWADETRIYLDNPSHYNINVVMWAWCNITGHDITRYITNMEQLISEYGVGGSNDRAAEYPVEFIFMTGHSTADGDAGAAATAAAQIRNHCITNNRWLVDYYDMECYDPDNNYFGDKYIGDNLRYSTDEGNTWPYNWAEDYIIEHPTGDLYNLTMNYYCPYCNHSDADDGWIESKLNCVLKGMAAWWLFARLAGWDGSCIEVSSVTKGEITWTFDKEYLVGQFCNGDYYVVAPDGLSIISFTPASTLVEGLIINGTMVNPTANVSQQGYDQAGNGTIPYSAALNKAYGVNVENPLIVPAGSSVISTISGNFAVNHSYIDHCEILTVLATNPPVGSFRPSYVGTDKSIIYTKSDLNYSILANESPVTGTPSLSTIEEYMSGPWLDHITWWVFEEFHPTANMPWYAAQMADKLSYVALMLNLNYTDIQKETLFIRMVQYGLDSYGVLLNGISDHGWWGDGGVAQGRKFPIFLAAYALNDTAMKAIFPKTGDYAYSNGYYEGNLPSDLIHFGEDDQTFIITQRDVDRGIGYVSGDIGTAEWGIRHVATPSSDNPAWTAAYRQCCNAWSWIGYLTAVRMMGLQTEWNHDVIFDYMERYLSIETEWLPGEFETNMYNAYW